MSQFSDLATYLTGKLNAIISSVNNLKNTVNGKANSSHTHNASDITNGTISKDRVIGSRAVDRRSYTSNEDPQNFHLSGDKSSEWFFTANSPIGAYGSGFSVSGWDSGAGYHVWQMAGRADNSSALTDRWFLRTGKGTTWNAWREIWHEGNFNPSAKADAAALNNHQTDNSNPHGVTKSQVGLSNVDNTSDANKPISNATQSALNGKADSSHTHSVNDVTGLSSTLDTLVTLSGGNNTAVQRLSFVRDEITASSADLVANDIWKRKFNTSGSSKILYVLEDFDDMNVGDLIVFQAIDGDIDIKSDTVNVIINNVAGATETISSANPSWRYFEKIDTNKYILYTG